jgi:hypothetical protein
MTYPVKMNMTIKFLLTNRAHRIILLNFILIGLYPVSCYSQDLYDLGHSMKYSEYLFSSRQYSLAAEEYERLLFFDKGNINFKYYLIKSYRLSGDLNSGIKRIYSFYGNSPDTIPRILAKEFLKLQLLKDSSALVESFISHNNNLSPEDKVIFHSFNLLLLGEYKNANLFVLENAKSISVFPDGIITLAEKASKVKFKSPLIAAGFSAIIPGTGKFYTKNWSDGLFSMLFVAGNAWQAYRGFHEHGIKVQ